jgi:hypothetical protein
MMRTTCSEGEFGEDLFIRLGRRARGSEPGSVSALGFECTLLAIGAHWLSDSA